MKKGWNQFFPEGNEKKKKQIPRSRLQQNKDKLYHGTQQSPQEHPERGNAASNQ
jgi:hypothetical protein